MAADRRSRRPVVRDRGRPSLVLDVSRGGLGGSPAFGGDARGAVLCAGTASGGHHGGAVGAVILQEVGLGAGIAPVAMHRLGNSSALPRVVTWVRPAGEVRSRVPSLLFGPAPKRLHEVMAATELNTF